MFDTDRLEDVAFFYSLLADYYVISLVVAHLIVQLWKLGLQMIAWTCLESFFDINLSNLTQDLTRFSIQAKGPDGKWTRKPLAYRESNNVQ